MGQRPVSEIAPIKRDHDDGTRDTREPGGRTRHRRRRHTAMPNTITESGSRISIRKNVSCISRCVSLTSAAGQENRPDEDDHDDGTRKTHETGGRARHRRRRQTAMPNTITESGSRISIRKNVSCISRCVSRTSAVL